MLPAACSTLQWAFACVQPTAPRQRRAVPVPCYRLQLSLRIGGMPCASLIANRGCTFAGPTGQWRVRSFSCTVGLVELWAPRSWIESARELWGSSDTLFLSSPLGVAFSAGQGAVRGSFLGCLGTCFASSGAFLGSFRTISGPSSTSSTTSWGKAPAQVQVGEVPLRFLRVGPLLGIWTKPTARTQGAGGDREASTIMTSTVSPSFKLDLLKISLLEISPLGQSGRLRTALGEAQLVARILGPQACQTITLGPPSPFQTDAEPQPRAAAAPQLCA